MKEVISKKSSRWQMVVASNMNCHQSPKEKFVQQISISIMTRILSMSRFSGAVALPCFSTLIQLQCLPRKHCAYITCTPHLFNISYCLFVLLWAYLSLSWEENKLAPFMCSCVHVSFPVCHSNCSSC